MPSSRSSRGSIGVRSHTNECSGRACEDPRSSCTRASSTAWSARSSYATATDGESHPDYGGTEGYINSADFPRMMAVDAGSRVMRAGSQLEKVLASGGFAVTAEIHPPASADPSSIERQAAMDRGLVDACNVTDGQRALVRISSLAAATLVLRDRNRIGIQSDLLGASALGIRNVLCLWGDPPPPGTEPDAKAVYDLTT